MTQSKDEEVVVIGVECGVVGSEGFLECSHVSYSHGWSVSEELWVEGQTYPGRPGSMELERS